MARQFNILATTERINEGRAGSELWMLLRAVGDEAPVVERMGIWGIIIAKTPLEPAEAVAKMREEFIKKPDSIQALFRVIPIQRLVPTTLEEIVKNTTELAAAIGPEETYRITVEKRRTRLGSHEIIDAVADKIERKVNLDNPDWVILIETAGKNTGVSVVRPASMLNVQKERVRLATEAKKRAALDNKPA
ncbi:MAG: THUMP domain-containing protein [Candidatus Bathyarchaeota archaeon]|nr:THUMP domain-containing protein [Candidatus Bathyarchaeota archaeon]